MWGPATCSRNTRDQTSISFAAMVSPKNAPNHTYKSRVSSSSSLSRRDHKNVKSFSCHYIPNGIDGTTIVCGAGYAMEARQMTDDELCRDLLSNVSVKCDGRQKN